MQHLSFTPASWRGTLPADKASGARGVSFDLADGTTVRLWLSAECARHVHETFAPGFDEASNVAARKAMDEQVPNWRQLYPSNDTGDQSNSSSLIPSDPRSVPSDGVNV